MSIRFADPKPGHCSACLNSFEGPYVDMDASYDGAIILDPESRLPVVWPEGGSAWNEDLYLCAACVRSAADLLVLEPDVYAALERENESLKAENHLWRERTRDLTDELKRATDDRLGEAPKRSVGRPRKVLV